LSQLEPWFDVIAILLVVAFPFAWYGLSFADVIDSAASIAVAALFYVTALIIAATLALKNKTRWRERSSRIKARFKRRKN